MSNSTAQTAAEAVSVQTSSVAARAANQGAIASLVGIASIVAASQGVPPDLIYMGAPVLMGFLTTVAKVLRNVGNEMGWGKYFS